MGLFLRALVLEDKGTQLKLGHKLNSGVAGWNDDEPAVAEAACELALRRFFGSEYDVRAVTVFVAELRARLREKNRATVGQLEAEAVIRSALGERDVDLSGVKRVTLSTVRLTVAGEVCLRLDLDGLTVDEWIAEAERLAFDRGWNPPLADS